MTEISAPAQAGMDMNTGGQPQEGQQQASGMPVTAGGPGPADGVNPATPIPANAETALELDGPSTTNRNVPNEQGEQTDLTDKPDLDTQNTETTTGAILQLASKILDGQEFSSEQEAAEALETKISEDQAYIKANTEANQRLIEIFKSSPELIDLIHLMNKGAGFLEALPYITGEADPQDNFDQTEDSWQKSAAERTKAKSEHDKMIKQVSENINVSVRNIQDFAKENSMSDDDAADFLNQMEDVLDNVAKGNITRDIMVKFQKGLSYDNKVKDITETAEIKGRNEAIDEIKGRKAQQVGDGLPHPKSSSTASKETDSENNPAAFIIRNINSSVESRRF